MPEETVFHYTDTSGLLGILQKQVTLRATDLRFVNDAQELVYARHEVLEALRTVTLGGEAESSAKQFDPRNYDFEMYRSFVVDELTDGAFGVYAVCFCESGDLLSQWRGYGKNEGYAIEFSVASLRGDENQDGQDDVLDAEGLTLLKVEYGPDAAREVAERAARIVRQTDPDELEALSDFPAGLLIARLLGAVKHPGFVEEREWRLVAAYRDIGGPGIGPHYGVKTKFRPSALGMSPFIEVPLQTEAVVSVRVGPGDRADLRQVAVRRLLDSIGSKALVHPPTIPFRG